MMYGVLTGISARAAGLRVATLVVWSYALTVEAMSRPRKEMSMPTYAFSMREAPVKEGSSLTVSVAPDVEVESVTPEWKLSSFLVPAAASDVEAEVTQERPYAHSRREQSAETQRGWHLHLSPREHVPWPEHLFGHAAEASARVVERKASVEKSCIV